MRKKYEMIFIKKNKTKPTEKELKYLQTYSLRVKKYI